MKNGTEILVRLPEPEKLTIEECAKEDSRSVNNWCRIALAAQALEQTKRRRKGQ